MKIIIVGTAHPYRGGIAAFNHRMAEQLLKEKHDVEIYNFSLQYPSILFPGKTQYSDDPAPEGIPITRNVNSCNPFNWLKVGRRLRRSGADLIIMRFWLPFMGPCLGSIARFAGRKIRKVAVLDNLIPHEKRIGDKIFARYFIKSMNAMLAMSQSVLDDTYLFDSTKPRTLSPHPIYDTYGTPVSKQEAAKALGLDPAEDYMLFFGFIRDYKGLDLIMKAMAEPELKESSAKLVVAGEFYNNSEQYLALERELGLEGRIIWRTDFIPQEQVANYFCAADLIVQPYKSATQSGVTQIGYHFEKPMLVTDVGGLSEIILDGRTGYVTQPDPKEIARAVASYFKERPDFLQATREQKKKYGWDTFTQAIYSLAKPE